MRKKPAATVRRGALIKERDELRDKCGGLKVLVEQQRKQIEALQKSLGIALRTRSELVELLKAQND